MSDITDDVVIESVEVRRLVRGTSRGTPFCWDLGAKAWADLIAKGWDADNRAFGVGPYPAPEVEEEAEEEPAENAEPVRSPLSSVYDALAWCRRRSEERCACTNAQPSLCYFIHEGAQGACDCICHQEATEEPRGARLLDLDRAREWWDRTYPGMEPRIGALQAVAVRERFFVECHEQEQEQMIGSAPSREENA